MAQGKSAKDQLGVDLVEATPPERVEIVAPDVEETRPDFLLDKFKTADDQARGYAELEKKLVEDAEARKRMESQIEGLTKVVEELRPTDAPATPQNDMKEQLLAAYEADPIGTIAYLAQQAAGNTVEERLKEIQTQNDPAQKQSSETQNQMLAMMVDRQLGETFSDWGEYRDRVGVAIEEDRSLLPPNAFSSPNNTVAAISRVYKVLKAEDILKQAEEGGGGFVTDQMKRQAQSLSGAGGRPPANDPTDEKMAQLQAAAKGMSYSAFRT